MLTNLRRNIMGTASFDAQFPGMRKPADFIVYPVPKGESPKQLTIQSDTRMGLVDLVTGNVTLSAPCKNPGSHALRGAPVVGALNGEALVMLRAAIEATAGPMVGGSVVKCDNSGAAGALGLV